MLVTVGKWSLKFEIQVSHIIRGIFKGCKVSEFADEKTANYEGCLYISWLELRRLG
jgi:hypothetical protein